MGVCVVVDPAGALVTSPTTENCPYVLMTAEEYADVIPFLRELFALPDAPQIAAAWMGGFALPLILFLVAWGYQKVISFAEEKED